MGVTCSKCSSIDQSTIDGGGHGKLKPHYYSQGGLNDIPDQQVHQLMKRSVQMYVNQTTTTPDEDAEEEMADKEAAVPRNPPPKPSKKIDPTMAGQHHLLFKQQQKNNAALTIKTMPPPFSDPSTDAKTFAKSSLTEATNPEGIEIEKPDLKQMQQQDHNPYPTRLVMRRHPVRTLEEGISGTHIYAIRWPAGKPLSTGQEDTEEDDVNKTHALAGQQEQCPRYRRNDSNNNNNNNNNSNSNSIGDQSIKNNSNNVPLSTSPPPLPLDPKIQSMKPDTQILSIARDMDDPTSTTASVDYMFQPSAMCATPNKKVRDWVTVSAEHNVYVADVGLTPAECDHIVAVTEHECRGQYAAYTYAKQTLGCREYPELALAVKNVVHTVTHAILEFSAMCKPDGTRNCKHNALALDDREPHMVKYDVTKKERQKLDMHTDKSEWTFLISLSNGSGLDFAGGGTYFECLDSTVHIQRGQALIFPGKLRHCGQRISAGLRFLLVGFLVDKTPSGGNNTNNMNSNAIIKKATGDDSNCNKNRTAPLINSMP